MNCRDAQELLQQSLDGTPLESPEWLAHLRHCTDCRALASASRRLQDALRLGTVPLPPSDLAQRIVARVLQERRHVQRRLRRRWAIGLGLAAGVMLALTGILRQLAPPVRPIATANPQQSLPQPTAAAIPQQRLQGDPAPAWREPTAELSHVFTALSNETAKAGEGLSEGLEPVATSARRAVDLFLRELPMETETN